jgi:hypothetical protein
MLLLPNLPSGHSIFCDDIRYEVNGTRSLVGVYGDAINIASNQPVILPKLCIDITLRIDQKMLPRTMGLLVIFETEDFVETELAKAEFEFPEMEADSSVANPFVNRDGLAIAQLSAQMQAMNIVISENGRIKVRGVDGDDLIALGSLGVKLIPHEPGNSA